MRLSHFLPKDRVLRKITVGVLSIHLLCFLGAVFDGAFIAKKRKHPPLIVKTVIIQPTINVAQAQIKHNTSPSTSSSVKPKMTPPPTHKPLTPTSTHPVAKTITKKPRDKLTDSKKPQRVVPKDLLQELEHSIAQLESKKEKLSSKQPLSQIRSPHTTPLQIDRPHTNAFAPNMIGEIDYADSLIQYLHASLHLPELGDVKIQLTLRQDGSVVKLVVLNAESEINKTYLESTLPRLKFPPLEGAFAKKKECTFCLNFCNEM